MASVDSPKGLLALSPELIHKVVSHLGSEHSQPMQSTLANIRLICRYLSEALKYDMFKSIIFDFGGNDSVSVQYVKSRLFCPANVKGGDAVSRYTTQLTIKNLSKDSWSYDDDDDDEYVDVLITHLKESISLFHNLRSVL